MRQQRQEWQRAGEGKETIRTHEGNTQTRETKRHLVRVHDIKLYSLYPASHTSTALLQLYEPKINNLAALIAIEVLK